MGKPRFVRSWRAVIMIGLAGVAVGGLGSTVAVVPASAAGSASAVPGVTATQISIGAISSKTGPLAGYFGGLSPGMIAYFKMIDAEGGVNGRQIVLTSNLDDGGSPSQFTQDTHTLVDQDHVFAAAVASAWFTPGYFVSTKTPTYGYNVSSNWQTAPNLFAVGGSTQIYKAGFPTLAYFIKKVGAKSVAFISYGPSIASSYNACSADAAGMKKAGVNVNFVDVSAQLGGSYSSDVQRMQQAGSQLVVTCMQASDNVTLARDIQQYGLKIKQDWLNGYDKTLLDQYSNLMQGVYVYNATSVPFEAADKATFGTTYAGMQTYISAMTKYEPNYTFNGVAFQGWQSAALIVAGIKAAGSNLTQANVVAATNKITNFTAGGVSAPVNWSHGHVGYTEPNCSTVVQVKGSKYVIVFRKQKQVFTCLGPSVTNPVPVTPPQGTPGS
jgi:ABC-type branched-subunit amino acid transport system substrate-binding protein